MKREQKPLKVLVVGSGGREHAIAWKLLSSPYVSTLFLAPGNPGTIWSLRQYQELKELKQLKTGNPLSTDSQSIKTSTQTKTSAKKSVQSIEWKLIANESKDFLNNTSIDELVKQAKRLEVDLVVVGNDDALAAGVVNAMNKEGILAFGPSKEAAKLESSKSFAKEIMASAGIPTAPFYYFRKIKTRADFVKMLESCDWSKNGWVIKADGLALGKGVVVCQKKSDAIEEVDRLLQLGPDFLMEQKVGDENSRELSVFAICDGQNAEIIGGACDYKRLYDGDRGPNTGGMGAYSPVPWIEDEFYERVRTEVFIPVLKEMKSRGTPFVGILYAGLMLEKPLGTESIESKLLGITQWKSPRYWVLEFNVRFGDPEAQVLLPLWKSDALIKFLDVAEAQLHYFNGKSIGDSTVIESSINSEKTEELVDQKKVAVVVAGVAPGYPDNPEKGALLRNSSESYFQNDGYPKIFYAGVKSSSPAASRDGAEQGSLEVSGGRVLYGLGVAEDFSSARRQAYKNLRTFGFDNLVARADIAAREE